MRIRSFYFNASFQLDSTVVTSVPNKYENIPDYITKQDFFSLCVLAGDVVQPASPSDPGYGQEHNRPARALPVSAQPGPILSLVSAPAGPTAQPAGDRHWCRPQPAEQHPNKETLQRGTSEHAAKSPK